MKMTNWKSRRSFEEKWESKKVIHSSMKIAFKTAIFML